MWGVFLCVKRNDQDFGENVIFEVIFIFLMSECGSLKKEVQINFDCSSKHINIYFFPSLAKPAIQEVFIILIQDNLVVLALHKLKWLQYWKDSMNAHFLSLANVSIYPYSPQ